MKNHDFPKYLAESEEGFDLRKQIYEKELHYKNSRFINFDTKENQNKQRHDVDFECEDEYTNETIRASEKIRKYQYFGDILVEVYSSIEDRYKGWLSESISKDLMLWFVDKLVVVNAQELKQFCKKTFTKEFTNALISEWKKMIENDKTIKEYFLKDGTKTTLIVAKKHKKR